MDDTKMKKVVNAVVNALVASADKNNNVIIDGVVDSGGTVAFTVPGTSFELHVFPEDNNLPKGKEVSFYLPLFEILGWIPIAFAFEETSGLEVEAQTVVYVLLMENDTVKIGKTNNFNRRARTISTSSGMQIVRQWKTKTMDAERASKIETQSHKHFKASRKRGEFFNIDFDDACNYVSSLLT